MALFRISSADDLSFDDDESDILYNSLSSQSARAFHAMASICDAGFAVGTSWTCFKFSPYPLDEVAVEGAFFFFPFLPLGDPDPPSLFPTCCSSSPWYETSNDARSTSNTSKHPVAFPILANNKARLKRAMRTCCGVAPTNGTMAAAAAVVFLFSLPVELSPMVGSSDTDREEVVGMRLRTSNTLSLPSLNNAKLLDDVAIKLACTAPPDPLVLDLAPLVIKVKYALKASISFSSPPNNNFARARLARMGPDSRSASCCCCCRCFFLAASLAATAASSSSFSSGDVEDDSKMVNADVSACSNKCLTPKTWD
mmetsp:Transcript_1829/g.3477  ORF Transcript_1829/g.3477 Transcript_1829/m.3477 type:complete len:311 (-) Transcript_1829:955-1887(-)